MKNKIYLRLVRHFILQLCKQAHKQYPKSFKKNGELKKGQNPPINNDLFARSFNLAIANGYSWEELRSDYVIKNCWKLV